MSQPFRRYSVKWEPEATAERTWEVSVGGPRVHVDGAEPAVVTHAGGGGVHVERGGIQHRVWVASDRDTRWVFVDGMVYQFQVEPAGAGRRRGEAGHHAPLTAPMPATVVRIVAPSGANVARGDVLVLLEAMKMELPLRAPRDGKVKAVHCHEGELVAPGRALVELD